eukprot:gene25053-27067_t
MLSRRNLFLAFLAVGLTAASLFGPAVAEPKPLVVFAAASLKNALDEIATDWQAAGHPKPAISYAASGPLAKQIEAGAPADVFITADLDWMNYAEGKSLIDKASRFTLLGNRLVLIAPKSTTATIAIGPNFPLAAFLGDSRLAVGELKSVPAGKYGKAALEKLGVWSSVEGKLAQADSVRAALLLVARGEAAAGIVYQTDAVSEPNVTVLGIFPEDSHPPIVYPAALVTGSTNPEAAALLTFLKTANARAAFEKQGFAVLATPPTN